MKKFFAKKVLDYKFTKAGTGHKLDEEKAQPKPVPAKTQAGECSAVVYLSLSIITGVVVWQCSRPLSVMM